MLAPCPVLQRHLLWMLPLEVWQEVLGFCAFEEHARVMEKKPASREFYFLLKQSLLELRFGSMLPSSALGVLWMASRDLLASHPRVLLLGLFVSSPMAFFFLFFFWFFPAHTHIHTHTLSLSLPLLHAHATLCTGSLSLSSPLAVEHLVESVPLPLLRKLLVRMDSSTGSLEELQERFAPHVRAPQRLQVARLEEVF